MKKKLLAVIIFASFYGHSNEIDLQIEGNGTVQYGTENCTENCKISTEHSAILLSPVANSGSEFLNWGGQQCDYGQGVVVSSEKQSIGSARGGAKTLTSLDLDNDGNLDLFGISLFDGRVVMYHNQGNGDFTSNNVVTDLNYPAAMATFDLEGDGFEDLLVTEFGARKILVYKNNGAGGLTPSDDIKIDGANPYSLSVADYNEDGHADLIIASLTADISGNLSNLVNSIQNQNIAIYIKTNNGYEKSKIIAETAGVTIDSYVDDTYGLTIVAAEIDTGNVSVYRTSDNFQGQVVDQSTAPYGAAFADLDNDGDMDIVTAHYGPYSLRVIYNNQGHYEPAIEIGSGDDGLTATSIGDFNQDGFQDIATGQFNTYNFYYQSIEGYQDCGVKQGTQLNLSAHFSATQTTTPSTPTMPSTNESNDSGGSFGFWLVALLSLGVMRRR